MLSESHETARRDYSADDLRVEVDRLGARIRDAEQRIAAAHEAGVDTTDWERFYGSLLDTYTSFYRRAYGPNGGAS